MTVLLAAEWVKVRSVRSTAWTLALTFLLSTGLAYLFGTSFNSRWARMSDVERAQFDPLMATFYSLTLGQLALVVLAVFVMTSEYSTGTIRGSLAAMPRRALFFGAKAGTGALLAAGVSVVTVAATFVAAHAGLGPHGAPFGAAASLQTAAGACLYLVLIYLIAMGLAALLRSAIATLSILLPVLFLGSQGIGFVPGVSAVAQWLPNQAGMIVMHIRPPADGHYTQPYGPWAGLGIMALWAAATLFAGYTAVRRRDA